jgi:hypothetical protein
LAAASPASDQAGAKVAITGRDDARLLEVARVGVLAVKADVASEAEVGARTRKCSGPSATSTCW